MTMSDVKQATPAAASRPHPPVNEDTEFFWDGIEAGELRIQKCLDCSTLVHPPAPACPNCAGLDAGYVTASGKGTVFSHVTFHKPLSPAFPKPYSVVVVELEEGTRLVSQMIEMEPDDVHIGLEVELAITRFEDGLTLPMFRRATSS